MDTIFRIYKDSRVVIALVNLFVGMVYALVVYGPQQQDTRQILPSEMVLIVWLVVGFMSHVLIVFKRRFRWLSFFLILGFCAFSLMQLPPGVTNLQYLFFLLIVSQDLLEVIYD